MKTETQILDCDYHTVIDDGSVLGLAECFGVPAGLIDYGYNQTCSVDWELQPEGRSWGLESISVFATKVTASVEWEVYTEDVTEEEKAKLIAAGGTEYSHSYGTISGQIEVNSSEKWNGKEWQLESEFGLQEDGMCCPADVQIDFSNMSIIVS